MKKKMVLRARAKAIVEEGGNKRRMNVEVKNQEKKAFLLFFKIWNWKRKK
jgi:hypothetical protein